MTRKRLVRWRCLLGAGLVLMAACGGAPGFEDRRTGGAVEGEGDAELASLYLAGSCLPLTQEDVEGVEREELEQLCDKLSGLTIDRSNQTNLAAD